MTQMEISRTSAIEMAEEPNEDDSGEDNESEDKTDVEYEKVL